MTSLSDYRPRSQLVLPEHRVERARFPAVDAHAHLGRWLSDWVGRDGQWLVPDVSTWLDDMDRYGVRAFVNLDGRWGAELEANLDRFDRAFPGRIATFCHVDWSALARPGQADQLVTGLAASAAAGAAGLKVWKDLGLHVRDHRGELVLPDDPRLFDLWSAAGDLGVPVWWHVADPVAFFEPVDERNEYLEMLAGRPAWSYAGGAFPRFHRLIDAMEAVVAAHPSTTFVAVHGGNYAENLGWVSRMLDTYPNLHIDIAARVAQLGRQPRATRALLVAHPDRVLFGCDEIPSTGESYPIHFRFLETADECFPHSLDDPPSFGRWTISGLHLPDDTLANIYAGNALRLLPRLSVEET
ncbi:amidohydrolase family protein [Fodinicola acaciae]|uniref:amidohydrolase family protein n=1 Tax=Fodinicola acaciae TaxID=2681555 RepID=UPI001C9E7559|nr:amidohydrolase family protein [Fodinicola acaciae]